MNSEKRQLKILVDARLASAFKAVCKESGASMTKELSEYIEGRIGLAGKASQKIKPALTDTRKDRRKAMCGIIMALTAIRNAEEAYFLKIPDNLRGGPACEDAESAVCAMDEAIALLNEAYC